MKKALFIGILFIFCMSLIGCNTASETANASSSGEQNQKSNEESTSEEKETNSENIIYENTEYGFTFSLPKSWLGYKVVTDQWEGRDINQQETVVESGPILTIRHPKWTEENPRQDIPIMVFTHEQWSSLQKEKFVIGAAPILPSLLGQNDNYVFALPARYNFAFPEGYEEVEDILETNPLQPK
ncbi:hypothetical protein UACE39S_06359 [Ureibacillus acetophenoni]